MSRRNVCHSTSFRMHSRHGLNYGLPVICMAVRNDQWSSNREESESPSIRRRRCFRDADHSSFFFSPARGDRRLPVPVSISISRTGLAAKIPKWTTCIVSAEPAILVRRDALNARVTRNPFPYVTSYAKSLDRAR